MLVRGAVAFVVASMPAVALASSGPPSAGLSVQITDGSSATLTHIRGPKRFIDELDIVATAPSATDEGIDPVIDSGDLSGLDWSGVALEDEEWRPDGAGGFTRQRFYGGAAWMEEPSAFLVFQVGASGQYLPELPFIVYAGSDDLWSGLDGGFIRRFTARQVTTGCAAVDDCSTATGHVAQALVQLRQPQYPQLDARKINSKTKTLRVFWTADPLSHRDIPVDQVTADEAEYGYGFNVDLEVLNPPGNGEYYVPGEAVTFRLNYTDGEGNPLDDAGMLPTYADFLDGGTESGLRYLDLVLNPTLYYALKHREGNVLVAMAGPTDTLQSTDYTVPLFDFFLPQTTAAYADQHGFSAVVTGVPHFGITFGGLFDPNAWLAPVPNVTTLVVPDDALPGTYVVATKARRDYAGEAINTGDVVRIQVGTTEETEWEPTTGGCNACHTGQTSLGNILHGMGDRESCLSGCHTSIEIEPDAALDYRVHFVHSRSDRYPADTDDCMVCHVEEPDGIPRGYPGFVYPFD
jgi:hypothetical protein